MTSKMLILISNLFSSFLFTLECKGDAHNAFKTAQSPRSDGRRLSVTEQFCGQRCHHNKSEDFADTCSLARSITEILPPPARWRPLPVISLPPPSAGGGVKGGGSGNALASTGGWGIWEPPPRCPFQSSYHTLSLTHYPSFLHSLHPSPRATHSSPKGRGVPGPFLTLSLLPFLAVWSDGLQWKDRTICSPYVHFWE